MSTRSTSTLEEIRTLLLAGELGVGDPLQETTLAERLGVSRTPVREALHRLEVDGVVRRSGRGYVVAGVSPEAQAEITEVRRALEPVAAELAARAVAAGRIAPVRLLELRETVADLRRAGEVEDASTAASANHRFHALVGELSLNALLGEMVVRLNDRLVIAARARLSTAEWAEAASRQHEAVVIAIEAGDAAAAADAARVHVDRADGRTGADGQPSTI